MQGNLQDMSVADLIQHACLDQKQARLQIASNGKDATLYFDQGEIVHAVAGDVVGEDVVFEIINWHNGNFVLENNIPAPAHTITRNWAGVLLDAARLVDEQSNASNAQHSPKIQPSMEKKNMATKKKSELLAEALATLLAESSDIHGAAIVGIDGLVYSANVPQKGMDENLVGAAAASILGLSKRSVEQMKSGTFKQTLIQGDDGNIIVAPLGDETLFVALTPAHVNLGMAFAEVRSITKDLMDIL